MALIPLPPAVLPEDLAPTVEPVAVAWIPHLGEPAAEALAVTTQTMQVRVVLLLPVEAPDNFGSTGSATAAEAVEPLSLTVGQVVSAEAETAASTTLAVHLKMEPRGQAAEAVEVRTTLAPQEVPAL